MTKWIHMIFMMMISSAEEDRKYLGGTNMSIINVNGFTWLKECDGGEIYKRGNEYIMFLFEYYPTLDKCRRDR
jgi:hypothetical protein